MARRQRSMSQFGKKRVCDGCSGEYFDLGSEDAPCPLCGATHEAQTADATAEAAAEAPTTSRVIRCFAPPSSLVEYVLGADPTWPSCERDRETVAFEGLD